MAQALIPVSRRNAILAIALFVLPSPMQLRGADDDSIRHSFLGVGKANKVVIVGEDGKIEWEFNMPASDGWVLPNGNVLLALYGTKGFPNGGVVEIAAGTQFTLDELRCNPYAKVRIILDGVRGFFAGHLFRGAAMCVSGNDRRVCADLLLLSNGAFSTWGPVIKSWSDPRHPRSETKDFPIPMFTTLDWDVPEDELAKASHAQSALTTPPEVHRAAAIAHKEYMARFERDAKRMGAAIKFDRERRKAKARRASESSE